ncbi:hypothetical protein B0H17DRAFT_1202630 [Mycena rosella]|uniref:DUF6532 domain-containing protein n=1 Tax=Mycena rosella TaxID=1033263 RepID=A0AAD7GHB8_MYCRO|nr:hypothetical protein B0H17DRAFT_1202630 [Mycena rosella]
MSTRPQGPTSKKAAGSSKQSKETAPSKQVGKAKSVFSNQGPSDPDASSRAGRKATKENTAAISTRADNDPVKENRSVLDTDGDVHQTREPRKSVLSTDTVPDANANANAPRIKRSNAGKGTLDRWNRDSEAIRGPGKRTRDYVPADVQENEAAPPPKKTKTSKKASSARDPVQLRVPVSLHLKGKSVLPLHQKFMLLVVASRSETPTQDESAAEMTANLQHDFAQDNLSDEEQEARDDFDPWSQKPDNDQSGSRGKYNWHWEDRNSGYEHQELNLRTDRNSDNRDGRTHERTERERHTIEAKREGLNTHREHNGQVGKRKERQQGKRPLCSYLLEFNTAPDEYDVLQRHRETNNATHPPNAEKLAHSRRNQQSNPTSEDEGEVEGEGGDIRSDGEENENEHEGSEGDNEEEEEENDEGQARKRRTAKDGPTPTQEGFYPHPWKMVFANAKDRLYAYLLNSDLFPCQDKFRTDIREFLIESIVCFEDTHEVELPAVYWENNKEEMITLIWKFVATFRGNCKRAVRSIVTQHYSKRIFPQDSDFEGRGYNQMEWDSITVHNVAALLEKSSFHQKGKDENERTNNFMAPAIEALINVVLQMGNRPLVKEFPEEFSKYTPNLIVAMTIFIRSGIEEYETGHEVHNQFTDERYAKYYTKGLTLMDRLRNDKYHWQKCQREWEKWAREATYRRGNPGRAVADDKAMDVELD